MISLITYYNEYTFSQIYIFFFSMVMHWQYMSICRGGKGILEKLSEAGINSEKYITFYSLRGYDKVHHVNNKGENKSLRSKKSLLSLKARREKQNQERSSEDNSTHLNEPTSSKSLDKNQNITESKQPEVPFDNESKSENDKESRFSKVSFSDEKVGEPVVLKHFTEEIYIHSKLMIVDDRYVIIGSGKKISKFLSKIFNRKNIGGILVIASKLHFT